MMMELSNTYSVGLAAECRVIHTGFLSESAWKRQFGTSINGQPITMAAQSKA
jgi:hypothetical protein